MKRIASKKVLLRAKRDNALPRKISSGSSRIGNLSTLLKSGKQVRLCIVRSVGGIGDVLMTTPALRELKRKYPNIKLSYAIDRHRTSNDVYYNIVKNAEFIDEILDARYVNRNIYDFTIDISAVCIRHERRDLPSVNRIDLFARALGLGNLRNRKPFFKLEEAEVYWAKSELSPYIHSNKKIVALHTASFEPKRSWPIENYISLVKKSLQDNKSIQFVVFDFNNTYSGWEEFSNVVNTSHTDLRQMAAFINEADLFIGPDSGPMHLAGALNTRSLVLFGSIPPEARINYYPSHTAIKATGLSCLGCWYESCPIAIKCMKDIKYMLVYDQMIRELGV